MCAKNTNVFVLFQEFLISKNKLRVDKDLHEKVWIWVVVGKEVLEPVFKKHLRHTDNIKQIVRQSRVIWPLSKLPTSKTSHGLAFSCSSPICGHSLWNGLGLHMENVDLSQGEQWDSAPVLPCCRVPTDNGSSPYNCTAAAGLYRALQASLPPGWSFSCFPWPAGKSLWLTNPTERLTSSPASFGTVRPGPEQAAYTGGEGGSCGRGQW